MYTWQINSQLTYANSQEPAAQTPTTATTTTKPTSLTWTSTKE